ncbi:hypothetical protein [Haliangium ochraceum]|uniref:Lipoprotein n=1 Tax=Haliangium ochraceum (strain DSM 14365 / JCM 11303 / SMP-2) TaxID=502025 RepID=D0LK80_HALO1|nr:hypothetical protein [Haliangium ochraceum]ACY13114.1 hypothetical protein Hoch_0474 [Haliangium ochraceum DSM 14365]
MRLWLLLALALASVATGCARPGRGTLFHRPTGTCAGACEHYLACKAERGDPVDDEQMLTCELECAQVFSGSEPLLAFESLRCEDAIAFVEGESGRGPGEVREAAAEEVVTPSEKNPETAPPTP